ncbi:MAG TPA: ATP synthase F1 subunit gamma [Ruminococcaceae bacterium]|nr:ATP synthase F1 subunit gamma [Oscillospiraceae bacterium]
MAGAGMKDIKRRIKSVESTMQITKAMELVASSKLRKAKERAEKARPFFDILYDTIKDIATNNKDLSSEFAQARAVRNVCYIVIAGDRGLAGGYNSMVLKLANSKIAEKNANAKVIPIGKKAAEFFSRRNVELIEHRHSSVEDIGLSASFELADAVAKMFKRREIDEVYLVYTKFISTLSQEPHAVKLLPLAAEKSAQRSKTATEYEPSATELFDIIVPQYLGGMIFGAVAESFASEQGARRTAMESASDNAGEMIESLNLKYNRARQAAITQEISEIVGGANALS